MRQVLRLSEPGVLALVDDDDLVGGQERQVVSPIAVQVAHGQPRGAFDGVSRGDSLGVAEVSFSLIENDGQLGRRAVVRDIGFAVAVEVARDHAHDVFIDGQALEPHAAVVAELVGLGRRRGLGIRRGLAAQ